MGQSKFERDNRKILLGMLVGLLLGPIILWVGYDLQNAPLIKQVTEIVLGAVFGAPAGAFITFNLIQRGIISAKFSRVKVTALLRDMVLTGLALVAIDLLFSWVTNINNFNLMQALFSWKIIGEFVSGVLIVLLI